MSLQGAGSIIGGLTAAMLMRRLGPARALGLGLVDYRWLMLMAAVVIAECALSMLRGEREPRQGTPAPVADASRRH